MTFQIPSRFFSSAVFRKLIVAPSFLASFLTVPDSVSECGWTWASVSQPIHNGNKIRTPGEMRVS